MVVDHLADRLSGIRIFPAMGNHGMYIHSGTSLFQNLSVSEMLGPSKIVEVKAYRGA